MGFIGSAISFWRRAESPKALHFIHIIPVKSWNSACQAPFKTWKPQNSLFHFLPPTSESGRPRLGLCIHGQVCGGVCDQCPLEGPARHWFWSQWCWVLLPTHHSRSQLKTVPRRVEFHGGEIKSKVDLGFKKVKAWEVPFLGRYLAELILWSLSFLHEHCSEYWKHKRWIRS